MPYHLQITYDLLQRIDLLSSMCRFSRIDHLIESPSFASPIQTELLSINLQRTDLGKDMLNVNAKTNIQ